MGTTYLYILNVSLNEHRIYNEALIRKGCLLKNLIEDAALIQGQCSIELTRYIENCIFIIKHQSINICTFFILSNKIARKISWQHEKKSLLLYHVCVRFIDCFSGKMHLRLLYTLKILLFVVKCFYNYRQNVPL